MSPRIAGQEPRVLGFRRLLSGGQVSQEGCLWVILLLRDTLFGV